MAGEVDRAVEQLKAAQNWFALSSACQELVRAVVAELELTPDNVDPQRLADAIDEHDLATRNVPDAKRALAKPFLTAIIGAWVAKKAGVATAGTPAGANIADPVEHYRGELVHEATDLVVRGAGIDFAFHRTYRHQTTYDGPLGHRWDHGYNLFLTVDAMVASLWTGTGRRETYQRHEVHQYYVPPDGVDATLEPLGPEGAPTGWIRRAPDGMRHVFTPEPGWSGAFRLARIEDRWGNALRFSYSGPNGERLAFCEVNHPDRWVRFAYDQEGRIVRVWDHADRTWRYTYDAHGDLIAVTAPPTQSQPRGASTRFSYTTATHPRGLLAHNLVDVIDAAGRHYLRTRYGEHSGSEDYNRVVHQRLAEGDFWFRYEAIDAPFSSETLSEQDRPVMHCWVKEQNGQQTRYVYNAWGGLLRREETHKPAVGTASRVAWHFRYDKSGTMVASRSPEGVVTQVLTGREHFLRTNGIDPQVPGAEDGLWRLEQLTADARRSFGQVLAEVRRAAPRTVTTISWADRWGDIYAAEPGDRIVKYSYEPGYGQVVTTSDPRTTTRPDPRFPEPPTYYDQLTRYVYDGPLAELVRVEAPTPTLPDGSPGGVVVTHILARDPRGRPTRTRDAVGTETETTYYRDDVGPHGGFPERVVIDPGGLAITTKYDVDRLGRVVATTLPRGVRSADGRFAVRLEIDDLDRVEVSHGPTPIVATIRTRYEPAGKPQQVEQEWRDPDGTLRDTLVRRYTFNEAHQLVQETWGNQDVGQHHRIAHRYNAAGTLALTLGANDNSVHFRYDSRDQLVKAIRGHGLAEESVETLVRDRDGRVVAKISGEGRHERYELDVFGHTLAVIDPLGHVTRTSYDKGGRPTVVRRFERRSDGTYWLLARAESVYDELGRPVKAVVNRFDEPLLAGTSEADLASAFEAGPGPGRRLETWTFLDAAGRVERVVDPLGHVAATEYDRVGRVVRTGGPMGDWLEQRYDEHGNVVRRDRHDLVRDDAGAVVGEQVLTWQGTYDERDRLIEERDGLGNSTEHRYDSLDRLVWTRDPLGNVRETVYDVYGNAVESISRRTDSGRGDGATLSPAVTRFEYDAGGQPIAQIDALGRRSRRRYDRLNRVVESVFPDGARVVIRYDRDDGVVATRDAHGVIVRTRHDASGRPVRTEVDTAEVDGGLVIEGDRWIDRHFDGLGRVVAAETARAQLATRYDSLGQALRDDASVDGGPVRTVARDFDDAGRLTGVAYPGGRRLRHERDAAGRLRAIVEETVGDDFPGAMRTPGDRAIAAFEHVGGWMRAITRDNGVGTTLSRDAAGRTVEVRHDGPAGTLLRSQHLLDGARNPRRRLDAVLSGSLLVSRSERFGYDSQYQLSGRVASPDPDAFVDLAPFAPPPITRDPVPRQQPQIDALTSPWLPAVLPPSTPEAPVDRWIYDLAGNRDLSQVANGAEVSYQINDRDEYEAVAGVSRTYDKAGNLARDGVHEYRYDAWRRLCRVSLATGEDVVRYAYDPAGRRVVEEHGPAGLASAARVVTVHDGVDRIADYRPESGGSPGVERCVAQYVHGDGVDDPLHVAAAGVEAWYHTDLQRALRLLTDASGAPIGTYAFDVWGAPVVASGPGFGVAPAVATGDASPASFAQPFAFGGRPFDPQVRLYDQRARTYDPAVGRFLQRDPGGPVDGHLYAYAGNHPVLYGDPSGLSRGEWLRYYHRDDEISAAFAPHWERLAKVCDEHKCRGTSKEHAFIVYGNILKELEHSVRTGQSLDYRGLWKDARKYELEEWTNNIWMYRTALDGGADQSLGNVGVFGQEYVAKEYFQDPTDTRAGVPIDALYKTVIRRTNPKPTKFERVASFSVNFLAGAALGIVLSGAGVPRPIPAGRTIKLFRGVRPDPRYSQFREAMQGVVRPIGGHSSPILHQSGNTRSIYTSWTTDTRTAIQHASLGGATGIVVEAEIPVSMTRAQFANLGESEVLVEGIVTWARRIW